MRLRQTIYRVLTDKAGQSRLGLWTALAIQTLILLNVLSVILESMVQVRSVIPVIVFHSFEVFSVSIFLLEYLLRLWSSAENPQASSTARARLGFFFSPLGLIDLAAILPFFLSFLNLDLRILRILRMLRVMRLGKLGRYSRAMQVLGRVLRLKRDELLSALMLFVIATTLAASLAYFAESEAQPDKFASIPEAMWWAVITLSTVGYGDVVPVTVLGRLVAVLASVIGVSLFALFAGILVTGFVEEIKVDAAGLGQRGPVETDP